MKSFECGTLVPGCKWHTHAETEADLIDRVVRHLRQDHNVSDIRPSMIENIKARIKDEAQAQSA